MLQCDLLSCVIGVESRDESYRRQHPWKLVRWGSKFEYGKRGCLVYGLYILNVGLGSHGGFVLVVTGSSASLVLVASPHLSAVLHP
jgi:hypothetical protein